MGNQAIKYPTIFNFIRSVKNSVKAVPRGNGELDKVWQALNSIQRDKPPSLRPVDPQYGTTSAGSGWQLHFLLAADPHSMIIK